MRAVMVACTNYQSNMAEFPELGAHCRIEGCQQLDFLPLQCAYCSLIFCKTHHPVAQHNCSQLPDKFLSEDELHKVEGFTCSKEDCKQREAVTMLCTSCHLHFCLLHRHMDQHDCEQLPQSDSDGLKAKWEAPTKDFQEAKSSVDKELGRKLKAAKNQKRAAQVQLMRLKSRAALEKQGLSIPVQERVHFLVRTSSAEQVVVASHVWSIGRMLDVASERLKVTNTNNQPGTPQLRFFNEDGSAVVDLDKMHLSLQNLVQDAVLHDGQTLLLQYV